MKWKNETWKVGLWPRSMQIKINSPLEGVSLQRISPISLISFRSLETLETMSWCKYGDICKLFVCVFWQFIWDLKNPFLWDLACFQSNDLIDSNGTSMEKIEKERTIECCLWSACDCFPPPPTFFICLSLSTLSIATSSSQLLLTGSFVKDDFLCGV